MFGSYRDAIQILQRIKSQHVKNSKDKEWTHPIHTGIYTLQSAIEAIETAEALEESKYSEYGNQFQLCDRCESLTELSKLKALTYHGKTANLCETCHKGTNIDFTV